MAGAGLYQPGEGLLKDRRLSIPGLELAVLAGRAGGPKVLALHGWLDNAHSFMPLAPRLEGLELVCPDLPGHGRSGHRPPGVRYHFEDYAFDVLAAADALGWSRFHLLGHSLGGAVSCLVASMAPDRVASLMLVEGLGPLSAPAHQAAAHARAALNRSRTRPARRHRDLAAAADARSANSDLAPEHALMLARRGTREDADGGVYWCHDPRLTWPSTRRFTEPQVLALLEGIRAPVLNIESGNTGRIVPAEKMHRRQAALPARTRRLGAPAGHHLHMENPGHIAPWILEHAHEHP